MYTDLETLCVAESGTIREAVTRIDHNRLGIVLVTDASGRLTGTVTDGDVRRAVLANIDFGLPVVTLLARKAGSIFASPITAPFVAERAVWMSLMQKHRILHLPLVDGEHRVKALVTLDEFLPGKDLAVRAVVMAGGMGARLKPLTDNTPKPMLPVGGRPLMEIIIEQLREAGVRKVDLSTHHISEKISDHFGDGARYGVELSYRPEDSPLGTAGALAGLEKTTETLLVMNGDILTHVDFRAMASFHRESHADLTVGVRKYDLEVPYGVVECEGESIVGLREKPTVSFFVNAGIYLMEPAVCGLVPPGQRFDMTDLIQLMLDQGRTVVSFPIREYWLDIGRLSDYEKAQEDIEWFISKKGAQ